MTLYKAIQHYPMLYKTIPTTLYIRLYDTIRHYTALYKTLKNTLIIHEENTKKNHKRVVSVYVIQIHVDLHKLKL
jgi:hypothetical protein